MKYIDADKLIAEIERLKAKYRPLVWSEDSEKSKEGGYKIEALNELMLSLPEEKPSEDLEKAADASWTDYEYSDSDNLYSSCYKDGFRAGWKDCREQMMKDAVEFECIGKKVKMTIQELINYYIDQECCDVADECGF